MPALFAALAVVLLFCMVILPDVEHKHYQGDFGKKESELVPFDQLTDAQKDLIIW